MTVIISILIVILILVALASRFVASKVRAQWVKTGRSRPQLAQTIAFILSFLVIFFGIFALFFYNVRLER